MTVLAPMIEGNYHFLAAPGRPFSSAILADAGFDLVRTIFHRPQPLEQGLAGARRHVESSGRPVASIASIELRVGQPFTADGFDRFNGEYLDSLERVGLAGHKMQPMARTNVAPEVGGMTQASLFAFTYTVPGSQGTAFRLSGAAEAVRDASDTDKIRSILDTLERWMGALNVGWRDTTFVNLYATAQRSSAIDAKVLQRLDPSGLRGLTWFASRPPIEDLDFELDAGAVQTTLVRYL